MNRRSFLATLAGAAALVGCRFEPKATLPPIYVPAPGKNYVLPPQAYFRAGQVIIFKHICENTGPAMLNINGWGACHVIKTRKGWRVQA